MSGFAPSFAPYLTAEMEVEMEFETRRKFSRDVGGALKKLALGLAIDFSWPTSPSQTVIEAGPALGR